MRKNAFEYTLTASRTKFAIEEVKTSEQAAVYARRFYHEDIAIYESSFILLLNNALKTIGYAKISQGGIAGTVVDARIICKYAVDALASGVMLFHNHPSGKLVPSNEDRRLTDKVNKALDTLGIRLVDHIILAPESGYYSFSDEGLIL